MKSGRTFWISNNVTSEHHQRAKQLEANGFNVQFVQDAGAALKMAREARPICVIMDTQPESHVGEIASLKALAKDPEFNGVRFLLSITVDCPDLSRFAISENFRDIVPMAISDVQWVNRILYANAAKSFENLSSYHEVCLNQVAATISSGRITWINKTHVRIECRGSQRMGNALHVSGAISQALNLPHISLVVEGIEKHRLIYRYSQALICRWQTAPAQMEQASKIIQQLLSNKPDPKLRAFVAISRPTVRTTLAKGLNSERFFVRAGLQKSNLLHEVSYFSPSVIFFDDKLLEAINHSEIQAILAKVSPIVPIVIFGTAFDKFKTLFADRKVFFESAVQQSHLKNAEARYEIPADLTNDRPEFEMCTIPPDHPWSKVDVHTPARLKGISPSGGHFLSPFSIGDYALAKIESPFLRRVLGRDPIIKIKSTSNYDADAMFGHENAFHLSDVTALEESMIATALINLLRDHYATNVDKVTLIENVNQTNVAGSQTAGQDAMQLDLASANTAVAGGFVNGSSALKETVASTSQTSFQADFGTNKTRTNTATLTANQAGPSASYKMASRAKPAFKFDVTIMKAIGVFLLFSVALIFALRFAEETGKQRGSKLGKEYSDFFFRMNPELRKKSAPPNDN
jgi:FixJ family two-component response regulator